MAATFIPRLVVRLQFRVLVTCRPNKNFDSDKFRQDISETLSRLTHDHNLSAENYNKTLSDIYNDHFPLQTRWITHRPRTVWYNQDLKVAKREKRQAERKYRKSGLAVHKQLFEESCATYNNLLEFSKCSYYKDKIENANTRQLFKIVDGFFTPRSPVLPTHDSSTQLVEDNDFFIQRIICLIGTSYREL